MRFQLSSMRAATGIVAIGLVATGLLAFWARGAASAQEGAMARSFTVRAHKYAFEPARLDALEGDVISVTFLAEDIPHSFTIDEYRISKRAAAGQRITFEFRADRAGAFGFYCDLRLDEGCRAMHGQLVVRPR